MTASTPVRPLDALDPAHDRFCVAVGFEAAFCYLVPFLALHLVAINLPILVVGAVRHQQDTWAWMAVAQVAPGSAGLAGVMRTVYLVWTKAVRDRSRWMTSMALGGG